MQTPKLLAVMFSTLLSCAGATAPHIPFRTQTLPTPWSSVGLSESDALEILQQTLERATRTLRGRQPAVALESKHIPVLQDGVAPMALPKISDWRFFYVDQDELHRIAKGRGGSVEYISIKSVSREGELVTVEVDNLVKYVPAVEGVNASGSGVVIEFRKTERGWVGTVSRGWMG